MPGTWLPGKVPTPWYCAPRASPRATTLHEISPLVTRAPVASSLQPARVESVKGARQGASKSAMSMTATLPLVRAAKANSPRSLSGPAPRV